MIQHIVVLEELLGITIFSTIVISLWFIHTHEMPYHVSPHLSPYIALEGHKT